MNVVGFKSHNIDLSHGTCGAFGKCFRLALTVPAFRMFCCDSFHCSRGELKKLSIYSWQKRPWIFSVSWRTTPSPKPYSIWPDLFSCVGVVLIKVSSFCRTSTPQFESSLNRFPLHTLSKNVMAFALNHALKLRWSHSCYERSIKMVQYWSNFKCSVMTWV